MISVYDCEVGDIVLTGDSYGMDVCVCIKEKHMSQNLGMAVVEFLCLTNGEIHESGAIYDSYEDDCQYLSSVPKEQVDFIIKQWKNKND